MLLDTLGCGGFNVVGRGMYMVERLEDESKGYELGDVRESKSAAHLLWRERGRVRRRLCLWAMLFSCFRGLTELLLSRG